MLRREGHGSGRRARQAEAIGGPPLLGHAGGWGKGSRRERLHSTAEEKGERGLWVGKVHLISHCEALKTKQKTQPRRVECTLAPGIEESLELPKLSFLKENSLSAPLGTSQILKEPGTKLVSLFFFSCLSKPVTLRIWDFLSNTFVFLVLGLS